MPESGADLSKAPEVTLLKSEIEAAAARVAERAMNTTLDGTFGVLGDVFGGWFGDSIKFWRTRRLVSTLIKTKEFLEATGIPIENAKSLPMGEAFAIFDGCSKQEDSTLTDMWASLLSNAMHPDSKTYVDPSFARILNSISGLDALKLIYINKFFERVEISRKAQSSIISDYRGPQEAGSSQWKDHYADMQRILEDFTRWSNEEYKMTFDGFSEENMSFSISNLLRLNLIYAPESEIPDELVRVEVHLGVDQLVTNDSRLRYYLKANKDRASAVLEKHGDSKRLLGGSPFSPNASTPGYSLSGLAKRFLTACSPPSAINPKSD